MFVEQLLCIGFYIFYKNFLLYVIYLCCVAFNAFFISFSDILSTHGYQMTIIYEHSPTKAVFLNQCSVNLKFFQSFVQVLPKQIKFNKELVYVKGNFQ